MISATAPAVRSALEATGMTADEFIAYQAKAWRPTFEALKDSLTKRPQERDIIKLAAAHLSDEDQDELLKLAVKPTKKGRKS